MEGTPQVVWHFMGCMLDPHISCWPQINCKIHRLQDSAQVCAWQSRVIAEAVGSRLGFLTPVQFQKEEANRLKDLMIKIETQFFTFQHQYKRLESRCVPNRHFVVQIVWAVCSHKKFQSALQVPRWCSYSTKKNEAWDVGRFMNITAAVLLT